ncbi:nuclease [bacterium]|nr:nuclease [bacterium]
MALGCSIQADPGAEPDADPGADPGAEHKCVYRAVTKVVDGDTFWIEDGSPKGLKVRMIGIDAPETRRSPGKEIGYYGPEAKAYLQQRLEGQKVCLEYDVDRQDRYGRALAYVFMEDGSFVNADLIRGGCAVLLTMAPNVRYAEEFARLQAEARDEGRGLWGRGE